jgi:hypothetical protein
METCSASGLTGSGLSEISRRMSPDSRIIPLEVGAIGKVVIVLESHANTTDGSVLMVRF